MHPEPRVFSHLQPVTFQFSAATGDTAVHKYAHALIDQKLAEVVYPQVKEGLPPSPSSPRPGGSG